MTDEFINRIARLMEEQAVAYTRLDSACVQLSGALVRGEPSVIESLTRAGESELLRMRSRLVEIMGGLAAFADARESAPGAHPLSADARTGFESASGKLSQLARDFERTRQRAAALASNGATFAAASIEECGVQPSTYRAPYARRGEVRSSWA